MAQSRLDARSTRESGRSATSIIISRLADGPTAANIPGRRVIISGDGGGRENMMGGFWECECSFGFCWRLCGMGGSR